MIVNIKGHNIILKPAPFISLICGALATYAGYSNWLVFKDTPFKWVMISTMVIGVLMILFGFIVFAFEQTIYNPDGINGFGLSDY